MVERGDDRWLWLSLGVFLYAASHLISHALRSTVNLSSIHDPAFTQPNPSPSRLEDSISLSALETLTSSPNPEIAQSAKELLISRFLSSPENVDSFLSDLMSASSTVRKRAKVAYDRLSIFSADWPSKNLPVASRMVGLIERTIESESAAAKTIRAAWRAAREDGKKAKNVWTVMARVNDAMDMSGDEAVPVLVVETFKPGMVLHWARAQKRLFEIGKVMEDELFVASVNKMRKAGMRAEKGEKEEGDGAMQDEDAADAEEDLAEEIKDLATGILQPGFRQARQREESPEEAEIRRRRREAMVLHEGEGLIGREDIIQPRRTY